MKLSTLILTTILIGAAPGIANAQLVGARSCDAQELNNDGSFNVENFIDLFGYGQGALSKSGKMSYERTVSFTEYLATPHTEGLAKDLFTILSFHSEGSLSRAGFTKDISRSTSKVRGYDFDSRNSRHYERYTSSLVGDKNSKVTCTQLVPPGLTAETFMKAYRDSFVLAANGGNLTTTTATMSYKCDIQGSLEDLSRNLSKVLDEVYRSSNKKPGEATDFDFYLKIRAGSRGKPEVRLNKAVSSNRKSLLSGYSCDAILTCENSHCSFETSQMLEELTK